MKLNYKPLWKGLIDRDLTKKQFQEKTGLSDGTMTKLRHAQPVSMEVLWKICSCLGCNIHDVVQFELDELGG